MRSDDVHDLAGNAVLVGERDPAKRMSNLLPKFSLDHFARRFLIKLQRLAHVGQERTGDEIITLDGYAAAKRTLQDIGNGNALPRGGNEVLDERHVNVARKLGAFHRAKFVESHALAAA